MVEWVVQYRISDPRLFLFKVQNPEETLRNVSEAVMRTMVGDRTVDEVITIGRQEIEVEARNMLADLVKNYDLGIQIELVQLLNVKPPPPAAIRKPSTFTWPTSCPSADRSVFLKPTLQ